MRIIGGTFKGRKFYPPANNWPTRPTTDFAKEALFNILYNRMDFEDLTILDLFGGTGNHSYEFISRGVADATYVDRHYGCIKFVKKTAAELEVEDKLTIVKSDVFKFIKTTERKFDCIIADPPYALPSISSIPDEVFKYELLKPGGLFIMEHDQNNNYQDHARFIENRNYGKTVFSFFE